MCICHLVVVYCCFVFFFKQKTAYEMRISDWSSDVCSSDLSHLAAPWRWIRPKGRWSARQCHSLRRQVSRRSARLASQKCRPASRVRLPVRARVPSRRQPLASSRAGHERHLAIADIEGAQIILEGGADEEEPDATDKSEEPRLN